MRALLPLALFLGTASGAHALTCSVDGRLYEISANCQGAWLATNRQNICVFNSAWQQPYCLSIPESGTEVGAPAPAGEGATKEETGNQASKPSPSPGPGQPGPQTPGPGSASFGEKPEAPAETGVARKGDNPEAARELERARDSARGLRQEFLRLHDENTRAAAEYRQRPARDGLASLRGSNPSVSLESTPSDASFAGLSPGEGAASPDPGLPDRERQG